MIDSLVLNGQTIAGSKLQCPVLDIQWHCNQENLLLALRSPSSVVMYDLSETTRMREPARVWTHQFIDSILCLRFNPFDSNFVGLLTKVNK